MNLEDIKLVSFVDRRVIYYKCRYAKPEWKILFLKRNINTVTQNVNL